KGERAAATAGLRTGRGPDVFAGRCGLRPAATRPDVSHHYRRFSPGPRRPDARLHLGGLGRELARTGVHELRRRSWRMGAHRRDAAAVLRAEHAHGHAVVAAEAASRSHVVY